MIEQQKTFGEIVGMEPSVPVGPHRDDWVLCTDDSLCRLINAFKGCDGKYHSNEEDRNEADLTVVEELLDKYVMWVSEYCTENTDYADSFHHCVSEHHHRWDECVEEWICESLMDCNQYDRFEGCTLSKLVESVCNDIYKNGDWEPEYSSNEYSSYSGKGCCLGSYELGECEEQVDVAAIPELYDLYEDGRLCDILEDVNCDACVGSSTIKYLRKDYAGGNDSPCFEFYHYPGGQWHFVVCEDRMKEAITTAIIGLCRS